MLQKRAVRFSFLAVLSVALLGAAKPSNPPEVGERAPDFTLSSTTGKKITLSQFRGKKHVLLEFYVADFGAT